MPELTYLEMTDPSELSRSKTAMTTPVTLRAIAGDDVRTLTLAVGRDFAWPSQAWSDEQWDAYLATSSLQHWAGEVAGETIGLLSLNIEQSPDVEIDSFGLMPQRIGQGLGGPFLTAALDLVWALPAERIWLHTSSHDHPNALENYLARGFRPFAGPIA